MNCQNAREQITDSLAAGQAELTGELTGHVQACPKCRSFHEAQVILFCSLNTSLQTMVNQPVPPSLLPGVRARMQGIRPGIPWLYRLLPVAAILVVAYLIASPLVRRSFRSGGVQVAVIPKRIENGVQSRAPLAGQPEGSKVASAARGQIPRHSLGLRAAQRPVQTAEVAVLVSPAESQGLLQLAAAVPRSPQWAQAMLHPVELPPIQIEPIEAIEIADLEVKPLSEENQ
jgi:hypothetical protein